jgi:hypothetical protein
VEQTAELTAEAVCYTLQVTVSEQHPVNCKARGLQTLINSRHKCDEQHCTEFLVSRVSGHSGFGGKLQHATACE